MAQPKTAVLTYLDRLHEIHSTRRTTPELSYRAALENLLNAVGQSLAPKIQVTAELKDTGSGRPDFGFFEVKSGGSRGVAEVKSLEEDVPTTTDGAQVAKYWHQYQTVLVTNYRDFLLIARDDGIGQTTIPKPRVEARYTLASSAETFWRPKPATFAKEHSEGLLDFLVSVLKRSAPILRPKDLADDLARHAREAKRRLEHHDNIALQPLKEAMETALGLHFTGPDGLDFFRSSLVQTLFYGLFSGWMLWRQSPHKPGTFDWKDASEYLALPLIGNLYEEIARPKRLADLSLREPLDWATTSLNRVSESEFFKKFEQDHAITLFYEPFLQAFDPKLRKELGVWYTPPEIVQYMVARVDQLLRSELGIADGLADDNVYILDPAAGTGSYLVEVARHIHKTLTAQGHGSLAASKVKKALTTRVFGFEILPAPYVVAHLQLGVLLRDLGTKLSPNQRCGMYLTNALTGWEPPKGAKRTIAFHFLEEEQEAAAKVKRETPILVILGNPPYNGFAGVALEEEADLIRVYKERLLEDWGVKKQLLDDLYVRFFRLAERRIAEVGGRGIICFISNYGWLRGESHPIMRQRLACSFDAILIDNLHGDRKKSERAPDGTTSETVFALRGSSSGIQVATAIATLVRDNRASRDAVGTITYRDFTDGKASARRAHLLRSLQSTIQSTSHTEGTAFTPRADQDWWFFPITELTAWRTWHDLSKVFTRQFKRVQPGRSGALVAIDREQIVRQMRDYFDATITDIEIQERHPALMKDEARYNARKMRATLLSKGVHFDEASITPIAWLPFDERYLYYEETGKLLNEKRAEFRAEVRPDNIFLACTQKPRKGEYPPPIPVTSIGSYYLFDPFATFLPRTTMSDGLYGQSAVPAIDAEIAKALVTQHTSAAQSVDSVADAVFFHVLAVLWSPAYRTENKSALASNWPRIPIPADLAILESSAELGRQIADLLLPDRPVPGVTTGTLRPELRTLAIPTKIDNQNIDEPADTRVTAGWGFHGQKRAVMCGQGRTTPATADPEIALDIWINDAVYWANIPADVWKMTIGGYPVIKKWLSYREYKILGRALKSDELTHITHTVRRLKAILLLTEELDANYRAVAAAPQLAVRDSKKRGGL